MAYLNNQTVLISGGASGIGALMGAEFLAAGASRLVIWDVNLELAQEVREKLQQGSVEVIAQCVDVTSLSAMQAAYQELLDSRIEIDVLVNNAGIIVGKKFWDHSHEEIERTLRVNTRALMDLTLIVLPAMRSRGRGHIVNISSAAAMVANPNMSVYCASKWAVLGWSDSLRLELESEQSGVKVTSVTPYYIHTGMFAGVRSRFIPILRPEYVARKIVAATIKGRIFLRMPRILYLVPLLRGVLGVRAFDLIAGKLLGIYKSMDDFRGRVP